jgi:hypothetical protein
VYVLQTEALSYKLAQGIFSTAIVLNQKTQIASARMTPYAGYKTMDEKMADNPFKDEALYFPLPLALLEA